MTVDPGEAIKVLDRYLLYGKIAAGGQAVVHFGQFIGPKGFTRAVAIKRLLPQFAADPRFSAMLLDEARLASRIRHPNVVSMLDVGQANGEIFLVMEYVSGESLANLMRQAKSRGVSMPQDVSVAVLAGVLVGLHAAHEARSEQGQPLEIVHRDVSPQNVMVGPDGTARVLDFGIARASVRSGETQEGEIKGKLRYMAPEHLQGEVVDRRADIYAAAVVLWELLTGERFLSSDEVELFGRILEGHVQRPSEIAAVSPELDEVVLRGLARDPEDRYATALEMAEALEAALRPASARQVGAWVEQVAGPQLAERAKLVAAMESMGRRYLTPSAPGFEDVASALPDAAIARSVVSVRSRTETREIAPQRRGIATGEGASAAWESPTESLITETSTHVRDLVRSRSPSQIELLALPQEKTLRSPGIPRARPSRAPLVLGLVGLAAALALVGLAASPVAKPSILAHGLREGALKVELRAVEGALSAPSAAPSPAASPSAAPSPSSAGAADPFAAPTPSASTRASTPQPSRPKPSRSKSRCDPPFYTDETGIRRIKRECL